MLNAMQRQIDRLLARAVVSAARQGKLQMLQVEVLAGEVRDDVELFEPFGLTGVAMPGAESLLAFVGGGRGGAVAVVQTDRRYRPTDLVDGEVALYTLGGTRVVLRTGGVIEVEAATELKINVAKTSFTGEVWANGKRIDDLHAHDLVGGGKTLGVSA